MFWNTEVHIPNQDEIDEVVSALTYDKVHQSRYTPSLAERYAALPVRPVVAKPSQPVAIPSVAEDAATLKRMQIIRDRVAADIATRQREPAAWNGRLMTNAQIREWNIQRGYEPQSS